MNRNNLTTILVVLTLSSFPVQAHAGEPTEVRGKYTARAGETVRAMRDSVVTAQKNSTVYAMGGANVEAEDGSTIYAENGSVVVYSGEINLAKRAPGATVIRKAAPMKVYNRPQSPEPQAQTPVEKPATNCRPGSKREIGAGERGRAVCGETIEATAGSEVTAEARSNVNARRGSSVTAQKGSTVHAYQGSNVSAEEGSTVYRCGGDVRGNGNMMNCSR